MGANRLQYIAKYRAQESVRKSSIGVFVKHLNRNRERMPGRN